VIWFTHVPGTWKYDRINFYDLINRRYWLVAHSGNYYGGGVIDGGLRFRSGTEYDLRVINGLLIWVAEGQEPMKLDIGASIKAANPAVADVEIPFYKGWSYNWLADDKSSANLKLICKPPSIPPIVSKIKDTTSLANAIANDSFRFALRYEYFTGEESVLSPYSDESFLNSKWDNGFNAISVVFNPLELPLPQGIKYIKLYVHVWSTDKVFFVKQWVPSEVQDGKSATYTFYGDYIGEVLDSSTANEHFHAVPLESRTLEYAKGRLILGDNTDGRDTPAQSSLLLTGNTVSTPAAPTNTSRPVVRVMYRGNWKKGGLSFSRPRFYYSGLYLKMADNEVAGGKPAGYYLIPGTEMWYDKDFVGIPAVWKPVPSSVPLTDLLTTYKGKDLDAIIESTRKVTVANYYEKILREDPTNMVEIVGLSSSVATPPAKAFLHNSEYGAGIVFYDRFMRKSGVVAPNSARVRIPPRDYEVLNMVSTISWQLNNNDPVNEIPEWAEYYAPVIRRNNRAAFFVSGYSADPRYAVLDDKGVFRADDGKLPTDTSKDDTPFRSFSPYTAGIAVDTTSMVYNGLGYSYAEGDSCFLIFKDSAGGATSIHELPVLGQEGKFVILGAKNIKATFVPTDECIYEIYRPEVSGEDEFYETGQVYKVSAPGTQQRTYSILTGVFQPDCYIMNRVSGGAFRAYAMSPNDLFWKRWVTNNGRLNVITDLGSKTKPVSIKYSDVVIEGSRINGASAIHVLNEVNLPEELKRIVALRLTSKAQKEGTVLLAIGETQTSSVYLGEVQLNDVQGDAFVAKSDNYVGTINVLRGGYGTTHLASVSQFDGQVFWYDRNRKCFVRYDVNGLYPISDNKFRRGAWLFTEHIIDQEANGKKVIVHSGVDPYNREYLVQRKITNPEIGFFCASLISITITQDPTVDLPNRIKVEWVFDAGLKTLDWRIFNEAGLQAFTGQIPDVQSPYTQYIDYPPLADNGTDIFLSFEGRSNCGGGSYSEWLKQETRFVAAEEPEVCEPPVVPIITLPNAVVGTPYSYLIEVQGSMPLALDNIVKPAWATVTAVIGGVQITGTPSTAGVTTISFDISNCDPTSVPFSGDITVNSSGGGGPVVTFIEFDNSIVDLGNVHVGDSVSIPVYYTGGPATSYYFGTGHEPTGFYAELLAGVINIKCNNVTGTGSYQWTMYASNANHVTSSVVLKVRVIS